WSMRSGSGPPSRESAAMAFDAQHGVAFMYGGYRNVNGTATQFGDLWDWNGDGWSQCDVPSGAMPRFLHSMAYDSPPGCSVVFGGLVSLGGNFGDLVNETWEIRSALPVVAQQPVDEAASAGQTVVLTAAATSSSFPSYRWRRHTTDLIDDGRISGAAT